MVTLGQGIGWVLKNAAELAYRPECRGETPIIIANRLRARR